MLYNQEWYIWKVSQPLTQGKEQCLLCVFIYSRKKKEGLQRWFHELLNIITTTRKPSVVVQWVSHVQISVTPWTTARQVSLPFTISQSLFKLMSMELMMPSNHLTHCCPILLLPSTFPRLRVFSNESALLIRWPEYWSCSFSISPSNEYSGLISFRMDRLDLLAVQGTLRSLLQHHSLKASILQHSAFFMVQLSYPYMTTGKTTALTRQTFVDKGNISAFEYAILVGHNFPSKE